MKKPMTDEEARSKLEKDFPVVDLHPMLQPWLEMPTTPNGWANLRHPLVYSVPYFDAMNSHLNRQFEYKSKAVAEAKKKKNWSEYIWMHEKPYRLTAFAEVANEYSLTNKEYWQFLKSVYQESENIWQNKLVWLQFLRSERRDRIEFMDDEDRQIFWELPKEVTVYRGYIKGKNKNGISFTLSHETAKWFANRFGRGEVLTQRVRKEAIFAYLGGRGEEEVIILKGK